jgi:putative ABC transport system ATP-binding protein
MAILDQLAAQGRTIVLVTHEREVAEHAQRIIHLVDGDIASDEDLRERWQARMDERAKRGEADPLAGEETA